MSQPSKLMYGFSYIFYDISQMCVCLAGTNICEFF